MLVLGHLYSLVKTTKWLIFLVSAMFSLAGRAMLTEGNKKSTRQADMEF